MTVIETAPQSEKLDYEYRDAARTASAMPPLPGIPYQRYIDQDFFDLEIEHVFRKSWLYAGHGSELPNTGSYKLTDISLAPVLIVRGRDGKVRGFLNSCRHRGATLFKDREGCRQVMTCQYHGWTYDLTGKLIGVPHATCFPGLNKDNYTLPQIRCEQWGGFIFVNFDSEAEPLLDWLPESARADFSDAIAEYPERPLRRAFRREWTIGCNWKALVDNFWETYHFQCLHAKTAGAMIDSVRSQMSVYGNGHGQGVSPFRPPSELKWKGPLEIVDAKLESLPGVSATLANWLDAFNVNVLTFPNRLMNLTRTGIVLAHQWPTGVASTRLVAEMFVEDKGAAAHPSSADDAADRAVFEEDLSCMSSIQQSITANPRGMMVLGSQEVTLYNHQVEIDRKIGIENVQPELRVPDVLQACRQR
jgi:phenylpropionate dioxygenase-like ring-hydroxylating dioxygenase large terminal subunit